MILAFTVLPTINNCAKHTYELSTSHRYEGGFHIRAVILAAGRGSRMGQLTDDMPKALVHCAGMTLLERLIRNLEDVAPVAINIGLGWKGPLIREFVQSYFPDSSITLIDVPDYEIGPLETLVATAGDVKEPTIICPVDFVAEKGFFQGIIDAHLANPGRLLTIAIDRSRGKGTNLTLNEDGTLLGIEDTGLGNANTGRSAMVLIVEPDFIKACRTGRAQGLTRVREVIANILSQSESIHTRTVSTPWFDLDTISDILVANRDLLSKYTSETSGIYVPEGDVIETGEKLILDSGISLEAGVTIRGPTVIAGSCSIGSESVIGPFVSMSQGTEVQEGCFISDAVLFEQPVVSSHTKLSRVIVYNKRVFTE